MVEKTLYSIRPSIKLIVVWILSRFISVLLLGLIFGSVFLIVLKTLDKSMGAVSISIIIIILLFLIFIYPIILWKTFLYKITNEGIYFKGGFLVRKQKFVPFLKITNIETTQNIVEQTLKLTTIHFQTAGTGQYRAEILFRGLEDPETPKKLAYELIKKSKRK